MVKLNRNDVVAVIAGGGSAPKLVLDSLRKQGIQHVIVAIKDNATQNLVEKATHQWVGIGEIGKLLKFCRKNNVNKMVFIGSIARPSFSSMKLDMGGLFLMLRYGIGRLAGGDNKLLSSLLKMFEDEGFVVMPPESINPELLMPSGVLGKVKPTKSDMDDINLGIKVLKALGDLDIGQSVIVEGKYVLGIEAAEGTGNLIKRCKNLKKHKKSYGVLVKMKKSSQDTRVDLPAIGVNTIDEIADSGFRGVAVGSESSLIIDIDKVVARANERKVFIVGI